jgi:hypothetical protein
MNALVSEDVDDPVGGGVTGDRLVLEAGLGALELPAESGDEQMDLGREVAVEGAEGDIGLLGHRPHLDRVEAALGGQGDGRVQDALATVPLRGGPEVVDRERVRASDGAHLVGPPGTCVTHGAFGSMVRLPTAEP